MSDGRVNYHFMVDDKFIDDFISDAEEICNNNSYIFTFENKPQHVKYKGGIYVTYGSEKMSSLVSKITPHDAIYVHFLSPSFMELLDRIPNKTKIFLLFWGGDFLEVPFYANPKNPLNQFLYDPKTFDWVVKKAHKEQKSSLARRMELAKDSKNRNNILATFYQNAIQQIKSSTKASYKDVMGDRSQFLNRITAICHWNNFDVDLLNKLYNVDLKQKYFIYNVGVESIDPVSHAGGDQLSIWLGNSDTETNNHLDALNDLKFLKDLNIKIICPLNYGNVEYAKEVAKIGKSIYGDKFYPILDFIDRKKYYDLMDAIDLAYMPHNRGQAGGNIIAFIRKGIKVYMKEQSSIYQLFNSFGIKLFTSEELMKSDFNQLKKPLVKNTVESNIDILNETISNEVKRKNALRSILTDED